MVHIESRKSLRTNSEYEIFVNLENENGEVSAPSLVKSLKRQISHIQIEAIDEASRRKNSERGSGSVVTTPSTIGCLGEDDVFHIENYIDMTNTTALNSEGVMIRKSQFPLY